MDSLANNILPNNLLHTDILIIGAGIVGLTAGLLLKKMGLKVIVIDQKLPNLNNIKQNIDANNRDLRVSAVTKKTIKIWQELGVWQDIISLRACMFNKMHVWDDLSLSKVDFNADLLGDNYLGDNYLGYIVENQVSVYALYKKLLDSGVSFLEDKLFSLNSLDNKSNNKYLSQISTINNHHIKAKLVIGADGVNSWVRNKSGIKYEVKPYGQKAIVCTVATEKSLEHTAWQNFLVTGPLAFLPLEDKLASIVWSVDLELADKLLGLDDASFEDKLSQAITNKFGKLTLKSKRFAFELSRANASSYVRDGVALIGDAAHRIHPLAGQGANIGILDAQALANVIKMGVDKNRSYASLHWLKKYEQLRWLSNNNMMLGMSGFNFLFSNDNMTLSKARDYGVGCVDSSGFLKRCIDNIICYNIIC